MVVLTLIMGFSIYLSFPLIFKGKMKLRYSILLVSLAIGILLFLVADIFSDVSTQIYPEGSYQANPLLSTVFAVSVVAMFLFLFLIENVGFGPRRRNEFSPVRVSLIVAIGMGLQNLTEGLVFGDAWQIGLTGLLIVVFVGFILQNFTEGFPIISPFLGQNRPKPSFLAGLYFIGGFPTIAGGIIGYFYVNSYLEIVFDGLAIGAILYVIIPMVRNTFKQADIVNSQLIIYLGMIIGFIAGFAVNAI
jgi:ZIP family zinc transporter